MASFYRALSNVPLMMRKSTTAVVVNLNNEGEEKDSQFVSEICDKNQLSLAIEGPNGMSSVHRHVSVEERNGGKKSRILKVHFGDIYARNKFLSIFEKNKPADMSYVYCRRDLTPAELSIDREMRAICRNRNEAEGGGRRWVVGDLELIDRGPGHGNQHRFPNTQRGRGGFRGGGRAGGPTYSSVAGGGSRSSPVGGRVSSADYFSGNSEN